MPEDKKPRDPKERFITLAEKRTTIILRNLELIGNLSNKRNYQYDDEQAKKIFQAIEKSLRAAKDQFRWASMSKKTSENFSLKNSGTSEEIQNLVDDVSELSIDNLRVLQKAFSGNSLENFDAKQIIDYLIASHPDKN